MPWHTLNNMVARKAGLEHLEWLLKKLIGCGEKRGDGWTPRNP